jgi:hypothetical protein
LDVDRTQSGRCGTGDILVCVVEEQDVFVCDADGGGDGVEGSALGFAQAEVGGDEDLVKGVEDRREAGLPGGEVGGIGIGEGVGGKVLARPGDGV